MLIFAKSRPGRFAKAQRVSTAQDADATATSAIPASLLRQTPPALPEVSELQVVRHYTRLAQRNFSIDTHSYPLGSCTMKYNPRGTYKAAAFSGFLEQHPLAPASLRQGMMAALYELQRMLAEITGMAGTSLTPMAGAQGEFAGISMIKAHHEATAQDHKTEIIVPNAAHGTNPASAVMCGYKVREVPVGQDGDVDLSALKKAVNEKTAGLMLTNPSTCGVFERRVGQIARIVHDVGGLLYYDGANLNAILGQVRPGDMGFDVMHLNLHKTFATPHGGGGPGAGPVCAVARLEPYLPVPMIGRLESGQYTWLDAEARPQSIGQLSAFHGNTRILLQALAYAMMLGKEGMVRVSEYATLNANYLAKKLADAGFELAYPNRRAAHEFIITCKKMQKKNGVTAMDVAKRLLDFGIHAPTTYFPLLVPECLLIEPTETETLEELDELVAALTTIQEEAANHPKKLKQAPHNLPCRRVDEAHAAKNLDLRWQADVHSAP